MPNPDNDPQIPKNQSEIIDSRTGMVSRDWYRFFLNLLNKAGSGGTVTSVNVSGGGTGLTTSGGPVTTSGTITIAGTLDVDNGGTGATTASGARTNLGAAASGVNADITSMTGVTGGISSPDFVQFDTTATVTDATGKLYYDAADQYQTLAFQMNGATIQRIGEELYYRVKLSSAATKGQVLMFTGTLGSSGGLMAAPATGLSPEQANYILGLAHESGITNDWISVTTFGEVKNIDTTGGAETWVQGDILYYNPLVTGGLTKFKPTTPAAICTIAAVVHVGVSNGILFARPSFGSVLGGTDGNVNFTSLASGNTLIYDAVTGVWENANLTAGANISITNGAGSITIASSNPGGTVTSVGLSLPAQFSVTGSPVTSSGTLTAAWASQAANLVFASPNGTAGVPTFRAIVAADVPTLNQNTTGTASNVTGTVAIANGGTGQTTKTAAFDALSPLTTLGDTIYRNGTNNVRLAGNTTATKQFLSQTGTGTVSAAPFWSSVTKTDVGLGNVENTALSTWAGSTNLTTLGTIATGTWNATTIGVSKGGLGLTSISALSVPVANAANTYTTVTGTAGQSIRVNAGGTAWEAYTPTSGGTVTSVTGTSPVVSSGGTTPAISLASGYGDTQNPYASKTANFVLAAPNGVAGVPTFRAVVAADIPTLNQNTTGSAATLTTGRTISITGDLAYTSPSFNGSANVTAAGTLATVNTNVGSFTNASITVNGKGLITAASSGTAPVTSVTGTSPVVSSGGTTPAISLASGYGDTQNPYASKTANFILAAPNGVAGVPTFRAVVAADIPTLNQNTTGTAANVTGVVALANGGSGQTTAQAAINAFAGATTSGSYLRGNGTNVVMSTIQAADVPTLNQNTTGTAANVTGTVAIANGGTGATTAAAALTNLGAYPASNPSGYTSNVGTVTSVSGTGTVSGLSLSGTVTSSGDITLGGTLAVTPSNFASQTANTVLAAPNGAAGVPTFRAIVAADVPTLNQNTTGTAANVTGTVAIANGGTGQTTAVAAFDALSPATTKGDLIVSNGTDNVRQAVGTDTFVLTADSTTATGVKWAASGTGLNISNDTTTATNLYPTFVSATTGTTTTLNTGNAKLLYKPSTGELTSTHLVASNGIFVNNLTIATSYTIPAGSSGMSAGTISISNGVTVTVSNGSRWVVV